jgi:hypothetical protein
MKIFPFLKVLSNTSGVFEKAKQFVCRVFGGGSPEPELPTKRSITEVNSLPDDIEQKKFQATSISLSPSQSYTSLITKSPPSSPITRQSSMSFHIDQSMMVTQIHSILDNIDSVLGKIEARTNRPSAVNENFEPEELPNIDQITQTNLHLVEHHFNLNDGSGDTTPELIDLLEIMDESNSILSSDESEIG